MLGLGLGAMWNNSVTTLFNLFTNLYSFLLDGVSEYLYIPNAKLTSYINGVSKKYTIITTVKRVSTGGIQTIFGDSTSKLHITFSTTNKIQFRTRKTTDLSCISTLSYSDTTNFYVIAFTYDGTQALGSRTKIYVNGSIVSFTDNSHDQIDSATGLWIMGSRGGSTDWLNAYQNQFAVINRIATASEISSHNNGGKPKNPQDLFGTDCKWFFNPDESGSTAQFATVDSVNTITTLSINMEDADKTTVTPY